MVGAAGNQPGVLAHELSQVVRQPHVPASDPDLAVPNFDTGSAELGPVQKAMLMVLAADLNAHPLLGGYVTIVGSADRRGQLGENQALGQRRADAAREFLSRFLIDEDTKAAIHAYSLGAPTEGPIVDDPSLRRVEVTVTRRAVSVPLPMPTPDLPTNVPPPPVPAVLRGKVTPELPPDRPKTTLGPDFWQLPPDRKPDPSAISQLSTWLARALDKQHFVELAGDIAKVTGLNRDKVRVQVGALFETGAEAAVKAALKALVDAAVNTLKTPAPPGPTPGPPQTPGAGTVNSPTVSF